MSSVRRETERLLRQVAAQLGATVQIVGTGGGRHSTVLVVTTVGGGRFMLPVAHRTGRGAHRQQRNEVALLRRMIRQRTQ